MSPRVVRLLLVAGVALLTLAGVHFGWQSYTRPRPIAVPAPDPDPVARIDRAFARLDRIEPNMDEAMVAALFDVPGRKVAPAGWPRTLGELPGGDVFVRLGGSDLWWREYDVPAPPGRVAVAFTAALGDHRWSQVIAVAKRRGDGPITSLFGQK